MTTTNRAARRQMVRASTLTSSVPPYSPVLTENELALLADIDARYIATMPQAERAKLGYTTHTATEFNACTLFGRFVATISDDEEPGLPPEFFADETERRNPERRYRGQIVTVELGSPHVLELDLFDLRGDCVGAATYILEVAGPSEHQQPDRAIVSVHPAHRRKGIALDLIKEIVKQAGLHGLGFNAFQQRYTAAGARLMTAYCERVWADKLDFWAEVLALNAEKYRNELRALIGPLLFDNSEQREASAIYSPAMRASVSDAFDVAA